MKDTLIQIDYDELSKERKRELLFLLQNNRFSYEKVEVYI